MFSFPAIPAQAGIQSDNFPCITRIICSLDSRLRGNGGRDWFHSWSRLQNCEVVI